MTTWTIWNFSNASHSMFRFQSENSAPIFGDVPMPLRASFNWMRGLPNAPFAEFVQPISPELRAGRSVSSSGISCTSRIVCWKSLTRGRFVRWFDFRWLSSLCEKCRWNCGVFSWLLSAMRLLLSKLWTEVDTFSWFQKTRLVVKSPPLRRCSYRCLLKV